jgi:iron complex outermembrane receptor protein
VLPAVGADAALEAQPADQLVEIVITAQKRPERLQDVTVAAQVVSTETLAAADIADLSDLNKLVPSVQVNGSINGRVPAGIRGISSVASEGAVGVSSGVAVLIDGVPVPSDSFNANNVIGIQNIEVLLGPQASLGGRAAASGIINLVTRNPTDTLEGTVTQTVTTDGEYRTEAFVSGPILERLDGSLSVWKSFTPYPITNLRDGNKTTDDVYGGRGKLLLKITDDLSATLAFHDEYTRSRGSNFVYTYLTPGKDLLFTAPPGHEPPFLTPAVLLPGITPSYGNLNYSSPVTDEASVHRDTDYTLTIEDRLAGGYTLASTTAYQQERQNNTQDLFVLDDFFWNLLTGQTVFFNTQTTDLFVKQTSEELKLLSPQGRPVDWLIGAFYSDSSVDESYVRTLPPAGYDVHVIPDTTTCDVYAHAIWQFVPDNSLVAGLRLNHDVIKYRFDQLVDAPYSPPSYSSSGSASSNTLVGDIALKHQFSPATMAYLSFTRGYSPEAYNTAATLTNDSPLAPVGKESINSYEIGTKGTYLDRTLTVNADVFDTVYSNFQVQNYSAAVGSLIAPYVLSAAGKAETRGVELDSVWLATPDTRLGLSAALIDAKFDDYKTAPCYAAQTVAQGCSNPNAGAPQDVSGDSMPNAPKFKATATAEQRWHLPNPAYELSFGGSYTYRSSAQMQVDQDPHTVLSGFGLVNLNLGLHGGAGKWSVTAFVNNLTNHVYYTDIEDFWSGPWSNSPAVVGQPARDAMRYAGLRFNLSL